MGQSADHLAGSRISGHWQDEDLVTFLPTPSRAYYLRSSGPTLGLGRTMTPPKSSATETADLNRTALLTVPAR
jgi:hypothetical protein